MYVLYICVFVCFTDMRCVGDVDRFSVGTVGHEHGRRSYGIFVTIFFFLYFSFSYNEHCWQRQFIVSLQNL